MVVDDTLSTEDWCLSSTVNGEHLLNADTVEKSWRKPEFGKNSNSPSSQIPPTLSATPRI